MNWSCTWGFWFGEGCLRQLQNCLLPGFQNDSHVTWVKGCHGAEAKEVVTSCDFCVEAHWLVTVQRIQRTSLISSKNPTDPKNPNAPHDGYMIQRSFAKLRWWGFLRSYLLLPGLQPSLVRTSHIAANKDCSSDQPLAHQIATTAMSQRERNHQTKTISNQL